MHVAAMTMPTHREDIEMSKNLTPPFGKKTGLPEVINQFRKAVASFDRLSGKIWEWESSDLTQAKWVLDNIIELRQHWNKLNRPAMPEEIAVQIDMMVGSCLVNKNMDYSIYGGVMLEKLCAMAPTLYEIASACYAVPDRSKFPDIVIVLGEVKKARRAAHRITKLLPMVASKSRLRMPNVNSKPQKKRWLKLNAASWRAKSGCDAECRR